MGEREGVVFESLLVNRKLLPLFCLCIFIKKITDYGHVSSIMALFIFIKAKL